MKRPYHLNKVIELLEQGKPVFGSLCMNGNYDDLLKFSDSDYDFVIVEMEHEGYDVPSLRLSLQCLLNRRRVNPQKPLQPHVMPLVRVSPNTSERNQWMVKQALDAGPYGVVFPKVETVDDALAAVSSARYPQVPGSPDAEPAGVRGWWPGPAARYWGLSSAREYFDAADLWPLDPDGEMLVLALIETPKGVKNLRDILRQAKGIGVVWCGAGDLSVGMGYPGQSAHPKVEEACLQALAVCKEFGVPCLTSAGAGDAEKKLEQGYRLLTIAPDWATEKLQKARKLAGR